jgi:hypothetical protein
MQTGSLGLFENLPVFASGVSALAMFRPTTRGWRVFARLAQYARRGVSEDLIARSTVTQKLVFSGSGHSLAEFRSRA